MDSQLKPVAICQHEATQGPAYLATFLQQHAIPYQIFHKDEQVPLSSRDYSAVVVLGSNNSVNDNTRWISREAELVQDAIYRHRPVLGHCFGGQLLAKVLGARVQHNPQLHLGWDQTFRTAYPCAHQWFGNQADFSLFYWHEQSFQLPVGATRVLYNRFCQNSGFVYGPHLALQCHLEVTAGSVLAWCAQDRLAFADGIGQASVQPLPALLNQLEQKVAALHRVADQVYRQWLSQIPGLGAGLLPLLQRRRIPQSTEPSCIIY